MTERGILFTGANVRLIQEGRKTQTRRPLYVPTKNLKSATMDQRYPPHQGSGEWPNLPPGQCWTLSPWSRAKAGDRMWVREQWAAHWMYNDVPPSEARSSHPGDNYWYGADPDGTLGTAGATPTSGRGKWRPSMFMPRWVCRLELDITADVRVERLNAISNFDANAEGAELTDIETGRRAEMNARTYGADYRAGYKNIWQGINAGGPNDWSENPWVVVIEFQKVAT